MGENSAISWTDHTWNPWIGCQKVSPACDGCYAEALMDKRMGRVEWGAPGKGVGTRVRTSAATWNDPIRWNRKAEKDGTRPFVFCASLADIFDNQVPAEWRRDAFAVMRRTPRLVYLLLTKRPQNIVRLSEEAGGLPENAAIGATVEDQRRADINIPELLAAKAQTRPLFAFLSCEPLLGPLDLGHLPVGSHGDVLGIPSVHTHFTPNSGGPAGIDWVIVGGETDQGGHRARPMHPDWVRDLCDQCARADVPFHFKQWGEWAPSTPEAEFGNPRSGWRCHAGHPHVPKASELYPEAGAAFVAYFGKARAGRRLDGIEHNARPIVREIANV